MNRLTSSSKHSMVRRIITALVMCLVLIPCLLFGSWYYLTAVIVMAVVAIFEMIQAPNKGRFSILVYVVVFLMVILIIFTPFFFNSDLQNSIKNHNLIVIKNISLPLIFVIVYLILLFMISIFSTKLMVSDVCYLFTMGIYIAFTFICMLYVRYLPNDTAYNNKDGLASSVLATYIVIGTIFNDIGAYFVGVLMGKHKMAPRISPNKTWEGFAGGVFFSITFSFLYAFIVENCFNVSLLGNLLSWNYWWRILLISVVMPLVGDIGDLLFSLVKRTYAIKDFGNILPGHGGVLDRIDSLSLVLITVSLIIVIFQEGWTALL